MNKKLGLISKILSGEKQIESRWYVHRIAPWNKISAGDTVYFKDSGNPVTAMATVEKVLQFDALDKEKVEGIIAEFGDKIALSSKHYGPYYEKKRYCILIFLQNPTKVGAFDLNKEGFGNACAWITVDSIKEVRYN